MRQKFFGHRSVHLITGNPRQLFETILDTCTALQILEQSRHRHTVPLKTHASLTASGLSFDCRTLAPIHHRMQFAAKPARR